MFARGEVVSVTLTAVSMRWLVGAAVAACLTLSGSAGLARARFATLGYPNETVTCGAVSRHTQLRWHDEQVLDQRAHALGLRTSELSAFTVAISPGRTPSVDSLERAYRSPSVDVVATVSASLRGVCTSGPGRPTADLRLVDDVISYGPQPLTSAAGNGSAGEVERFIANRYAAQDPKCHVPRNAHGPRVGFFCFTPARVFYANADWTNRTFLVTPQPRRP